MQERDLAVQELGEEDIGMPGELGERGEDEASLCVTPPRGAEGLTRKEGYDTRQLLVLFQEEPPFDEGLKNTLRGFHDLRCLGRRLSRALRRNNLTHFLAGTASMMSASALFKSSDPGALPL